MTHNCLLELPANGHDGEIRSCSCGNRWSFTKDEHVGNYWLPHIRREGRFRPTRTKAMIKAQYEAQKSPSILTRRHKKK
jgi:hypothetical protein